MGKEKKVYTDEEFNTILSWIDEREDFKATGKLPNAVNWHAKFGDWIMVGLLAEFICFLPGMGIWLYGNMLSVGIFKQMSMANPVLSKLPETGSTEGFMLLLLSIVIVFFAIIGITSCGVWFSFFFGNDYKEKSEWYKKEIEKSEQICDASVQDTEVELQDEMNKLTSQLEQKKEEYNLLSKKASRLESKLKDSNETFKREKKLWALEKKELQYQIKLKQGLVDEMDDADSPLGGLYN